MGLLFIFVLLALLCVSCDDNTNDDKTQLVEQELARQQAESQGQRTSSSSNDSQSSQTSDDTSTGPAIGGSALSGFLWKPISEGDGTLVILLPSSLRGDVAGCTISGSFGSENGRFAGDVKNGRRPHYRFSKPGSSYGRSITVTARTSTRTYEWYVSNGASRFQL